MGARPFIMQDLEKSIDMTPYQEALALYKEWERDIRERSREDEARELLVLQMSQRFGALPDHVMARIQRADHETLRRWATQVLTARSLDDVLQ